jgi:hypothetical protein
MSCAGMTMRGRSRRSFRIHECFGDRFGDDELIPSEFKSWFAFGSGVGIEVSGPHGAESLRITAVRVRPMGARVTGHMVVEEFPNQAAGVWGTEYAAFLRKLDLHRDPATVVLPRQDVIVRQLSLPGVTEKDLPSAIQFQMDGLHPYAEDDVLSSWARLPGTSAVLVAIARRGVIERYASTFAEAGVKIGCFTCSAAAVYSALRLFGAAQPAEVLAYQAVTDGVEFYGESPARPIFSASFDPNETRAAALACAELRIDSATVPRPLEEILSASPALPYAAGLTSACPRLSLPLNLLPVEQRQTNSRAMWIPTAALGAIVLMLAGALAALPGFEDRRVARSLQAQIAAIEPKASRASAIDRQVDIARRRALLLDDFRKRAKSDMDILGEMTRILPPNAWLNTLDVTRSQVVLSGETDQAAPLLKLIDASPFFEASEFVMPPIRIATGETFRIRTNREAQK